MAQTYLKITPFPIYRLLRPINLDCELLSYYLAGPITIKFLDKLETFIERNRKYIGRIKST